MSLVSMNRRFGARKNAAFCPGWVRVVCATCAMLWCQSGHAADRTRISGLSDVNFGSQANLNADMVRSQSICVFTKSPPLDRYRVTASGSGAGGSFQLNSGTDTLAYEVQWSSSVGQTSGLQLSPNQALSGQGSSASADDCSSGAAASASLIVVLRSAALGSAPSGTYTGSLSLLIAPE